MFDNVVARRRNMHRIATWSPECLGLVTKYGGMAHGTGNAWPAANTAIYVPFEVFQPYPVAKILISNGTSVNGNVDVGIYDIGGARLGSSGSVAMAGVSTVQNIDLPDLVLLPGLHMMAMATDSATSTFGGIAVGTNDFQIAQGWGIFQQASAFPLPNPATFAAYTSIMIPYMALSQDALT